jgi:hypothetical protein
MSKARSVCGRCSLAMPRSAPYCPGCGALVHSSASGARPIEYEEVSDYSRLLALLLCIFLGYIGAHRFYVGRLWTGVLWLLTGGLFGAGYVLDLVAILMGRFRDREGLRLEYWNEFSTNAAL